MLHEFNDNCIAQFQIYYIKYLFIKHLKCVNLMIVYSRSIYVNIKGSIYKPTIYKYCTHFLSQSFVPFGFPHKVLMRQYGKHLSWIRTSSAILV